jgi:cob(I)alamin adenosyltransferase
MVRLSKIYTKTGDGGQTMLGDGTTLPKHALRIEAYGTVDETNAAIGVALAHLPPPGGTTADAIRAVLLPIQNDLFDLGADLCVPRQPDEAPDARLRIQASQITWLEQTIDRFNENLPALKSFILPSGTPASAHLHLARTICRRAERLTSQLLGTEPDRTNPHAMIYLNRLSDLLFVLCRVANGQDMNGGGDVLWVPGASRARPDAGAASDRTP